MALVEQLSESALPLADPESTGGKEEKESDKK